MNRKKNGYDLCLWGKDEYSDDGYIEKFRQFAVTDTDVQQRILNILMKESTTRYYGVNIT